MYDNTVTGAPDPGSWGQVSPYMYGQQFPLPPERPSRLLPVIALVVSTLALVGVLVVAGYLLISDSDLLDEESGSGSTGSGSTLTGQLADVPAGPRLAGPILATDVTFVIEQDGSAVSLMVCPDTPRVDQGVVTVCHGTIDGDSWAAVVFFENPRGLFTLQLL